MSKLINLVLCQVQELVKDEHIVDLDSSFKELDLDSLDMTELFINLEDKLNVRIKELIFMGQEHETVNDLINHLKMYKGVQEWLTKN